MMQGTVFHPGRARTVALAAALTFGAFGLAASAPALADEVMITILNLKALDKLDEFSKGDFYAKVTIDGTTQTTPVAKQELEIKPNWTITHKVKPGKIKVNLSVLDKDLTKDDPIDINRIDNKRDLDFVVDTKKCRVEGFASTYKCGTTITRSGKEKKEAELSFKVTVKK